LAKADPATGHHGSAGALRGGSIGGTRWWTRRHAPRETKMKER